MARTLSARHREPPTPGFARDHEGPETPPRPRHCYRAAAVPIDCRCPCARSRPPRCFIPRSDLRAERRSSTRMTIIGRTKRSDPGRVQDPSLAVGPLPAVLHASYAGSCALGAHTLPEPTESSMGARTYQHSGGHQQTGIASFRSPRHLGPPRSLSFFSVVQTDRGRSPRWRPPYGIGVFFA